jgi:hypothetical protein
LARPGLEGRIYRTRGQHDPRLVREGMATNLAHRLLPVVIATHVRVSSSEWSVSPIVDVWCDEFNLAPTRRLYVNDVSERIKTKKILANYR